MEREEHASMSSASPKERSDTRCIVSPLASRAYHKVIVLKDVRHELLVPFEGMSDVKDFPPIMVHDIYENSGVAKAFPLQQ
jgi:hypothetical protein